MLSVEVERDAPAPAEDVLDTLHDPSPHRRGEIWPNITPKHFTLHASGDGLLDVTEGTFVVGVFWEGRIALTINHLGGRRLFGWYLGTALKALEKRVAASMP